MRNLVKLSHGLIPNTPVMADLDLIVFYYYSENSKATHLVAVGGATLPVMESIEQITRLKNQANKTKTKEKK